MEIPPFMLLVLIGDFNLKKKMKLPMQFYSIKLLRQSRGEFAEDF